MAYEGLQPKDDPYLDQRGAQPQPQIQPSQPSNYLQNPIQSKQIQGAEQYQQNLPGLKQQFGDVLTDRSKRELAGQLSNIRSNANSRGLLYSGLRQGSEAQAGQMAASKLAGQQAQTNAQLEDFANQQAESTIKSGIDLQQMKQQELNIQRMIDNANDAQKSSFWSNLFGLGGAAIGAYAGGVQGAAVGYGVGKSAGEVAT